MNNIFHKGKLTFSGSIQHGFIRSFVLTNSFHHKIYPVLGNLCRVTPLHSCTVHCQSTSQPTDMIIPAKQHRKKKIQFTNEWLPFEWLRRPRRNFFENSGDLVQTLEYDPSWPKPDFELSEELKTASDDIKRIFSLANASKADIKEVVQRNILKRVQQHPNDFDSLEVKIALRTIQIRSLFDHAREFKKDIRGSRIGLHILIHKRNHLLKTLFRIDNDRFEWLIKELKLQYIPERLGGTREMYCRKWDLRRLTKEYCENSTKAKKVAYQEELKKQQIDFLKEKEEILSWIEKEEKELANLTV